MRGNRLVSQVGKALLTANMAAVLRVLLHGPRGLRPRLRSAYEALDPFDSASPGHPSGIHDYFTIPEVHLPELIRQFVPIELDGGDDFVDGSLPWVDLTALLAIVCDRKPRSLLEIGTFCGCTTRILAQAMPESVIHTVDLPESFDPGEDTATIPKDDYHLIESRMVGKAFRNDPSIRNVVQHYGDTLTWDFTQATDATLYFIDGSHTYEYVRSDTEKCLAACRGRQATLLWHDCDVAHPGVATHLADMVQAGYPVKRIGWTHMAILDC